MPDIFQTREALIEQAAWLLGWKATGQPLENEESDRLDDLIDPMLATLAETDIIYIPHPEEIPTATFLPLAIVLASKANPAIDATQALYDLKCIARPASSIPLLRTEGILRAGISPSGWWNFTRGR
jgi:hypothetical protein